MDKTSVAAKKKIKRQGYDEVSGRSSMKKRGIGNQIAWASSSRQELQGMFTLEAMLAFCLPFQSCFPMYRHASYGWSGKSIILKRMTFTYLNRLFFFLAHLASTLLTIKPIKNNANFSESYHTIALCEKVVSRACPNS